MAAPPPPRLPRVSSPSQDSTKYGHTKGFFAYNKNGGFWMVHSTPNFPMFAGSSYDGFPSNEETYGQSFLCVSLQAGAWESVANLFLLNRPDFYVHDLPTTYASIAPSMVAAMNGTWIHEGASKTVNLAATIGDVATDLPLIAFGKNANWGQDLYDALVAPTLKQDLDVETWIRGSAYGPYCTSPTVLDVQTLSWPWGVDETETQDHSKWAIAADSSSAWVCIGDINRMTSQAGRGGGTVCFQNSILHSAFRGAVKSTDSCSSASLRGAAM